MEGAFEQPAGDNAMSQGGRQSYPRLAYAGWAIALVATAAAFAVVALTPRAPAEVPETRLEIVTPPALDPMALAISPDWPQPGLSSRPGSTEALASDA
jgi:hypothetical protein